MKKLLMISVSTAALFVAGPALAAGGNQSTVTQNGDHQAATVTQDGSNDVSTVDQ